MIYLGIFVSSFTISWKRFVKKSEFKANLILRSFPTLSEFLDQMTSLRVNLIEKVSQSVGRSFLQISHHCSCWKFLSSLTLLINQYKCPCMLNMSQIFLIKIVTQWNRKNTIRDGGSTVLKTSCTLYTMLTLLTLFTLFKLFTLLPPLTLSSLFILFKLLYTGQTVACMPIYIDRKG